MKQKLLRDIELDVHELKYLVESFSKEPTSTLSDLLKRSISQMQERLGQLSEEIEAVQIEVRESWEDEETELPDNEESSSPEETETLEKLVTSEETEYIEETETLEEPEAEALDALVETKPEPPVIAETIKEETIIIEEHKPMVLGECIKLSAGLRQSISLNDSFRFTRALFGGDTELMNRVIEQISVMSSYKTSVAFLSSKVNLNQENEAVNDFLELLKKYFNQSA